MERSYVHSDRSRARMLAASPPKRGTKPLRPRGSHATTSPYRTPIAASSFYETPPAHRADRADAAVALAHKRARRENVVADADASQDEIDFLSAPARRLPSPPPPPQGVHQRMRARAPPSPPGPAAAASIEVPVRAVFVDGTCGAPGDALQLVSFATHFSLVCGMQEFCQVAFRDVAQCQLGGSLLAVAVRVRTASARTLPAAASADGASPTSASTSRRADCVSSRTRDVFLFVDVCGPDARAQWDALQRRVRNAVPRVETMNPDGSHALYDALSGRPECGAAAQLPAGSSPTRADDPMCGRDTPTPPADAPSPARAGRHLRSRTRQDGGAVDGDAAVGVPDPARECAADDAKPILRYPASGPFAVTLLGSDAKRLTDNEYLNDTVIEFGLRYLLEQIRVRDARLAQEIHIFNTFFFQKMTEFKRDRARSYELVRKWTSRVDLFSKRYLIVPINEHMHWYLAIVVNPGIILAGAAEKRARLDGSSPRRSLRAAARGTHTLDTPEPLADMPEPLANAPEPLANAPEPLANAPEPLADAPEPKPAEARPASTGGPPAVPRTPTKIVPGEYRREAPPLAPPAAHATPPPVPGAQTYVLVLDSLGSSHGPVKTVLRDYLRLEARDKHRVPPDTDVRMLGDPVHVDVRVPTQPNWCDCGVYLLHYVERFFSDPARFVEIALASRKGSACAGDTHGDWRADDAHHKRQWWRARLEELHVTAVAAAARGRLAHTGADARDIEPALMTPLRVGYVPEHFAAPLLKLAESDWARAAGAAADRQGRANVELVSQPSGTGQMLASLDPSAAGGQKIDVAVALTEALIAGVAKGCKDYRLVGSYVRSSLNWAIITGTDAAAAKYQTVGDLRHSRVGVSRLGSGSHLMASVLALQEGWLDERGNVAKQEFVGAHFARAGLRAVNNDFKTLRDGVNQAPKEWFTTKPYQDAGEVRFVGSLPTPWPSWTIAASTNTALKDKALLRTFLHKLDESIRAFANPETRADKTLHKFVEQVHQYKPEDVEAWASKVRWAGETTPDPADAKRLDARAPDTNAYTMSAGMLQDTLRVLNQAGVLTPEAAALPPAELVDEEVTTLV
ncbi:hypothetical protein MSPP1_001932 [Malassezia sp. CBS 17886]|nr:hypothetical protein MSPP1_001932 [Malassezia sp. CBS 17886]